MKNFNLGTMTLLIGVIIGTRIVGGKPVPGPQGPRGLQGPAGPRGLGINDIVGTMGSKGDN